MRRILCLLLLWTVRPAPAQVREFPYAERFDSAAVPALPPGWLSSANRLAAGDFSTTRSVPYSDSAAAISTNATVAQWLLTPPFDLSMWTPESLLFFERRSGTHTSGVVVEASTDGGATFPVVVSDTLANAGTTAYVRRALALPGSLAGAPDVRLRWRIIGNGNGTTGTYRLDDVALRARARADLALASLAVEPAFPLSGESVTLVATVRNDGLDPARGFSVEFFLDRDHDAWPDPEERFSALPLAGGLPSGDSVTAAAPAPAAAAAADTLLALVVSSPDQNSRNDRGMFRRLTGRARGTVAVSEILYAPESPEPEWIEIASTIGDSVDLGGWELGDWTGPARYRFGAGPLWLPPRGFAVVTRDSARLAAARPGAGVIVQIGGLPSSLFNNDSDAVVLADHRGLTMDSVLYRARWGGGGGRSLERIETADAPTDSANWGECPDASGATPGGANYLTPLDTNVRAVRIIRAMEADSAAGAFLVVRNIGRSAVPGLRASLYADRDGDSTESAEEEVSRADAPALLASGDSAAILLRWERAEPGEHALIAVADAPHDMRPGDDRARATVSFSHPAGALAVNEIMYEPLAGRSEFVECFNGGTLPVDVRSWRLGPRRDRSAVLAQAPLVVLPGEYLLIGADSAILSELPAAGGAGSPVAVARQAFGLGNGGDTVLLFDGTGRVIDSVLYAPSWHTPGLEETRGRSLERINPFLPPSDARNWGTSADPSGGTPGRRNTLLAPLAPRSSALSCAPNPFSPDGDGFEDATMIAYRLPVRTGTLKVTIFDALGRTVRTLAGAEPTGQEGLLLWDGFDDRRERVPMGIYIILVEVREAPDVPAETVKGVVVVAARL